MCQFNILCTISFFRFPFNFPYLILNRSVSLSQLIHSPPPYLNLWFFFLLCVFKFNSALFFFIILQLWYAFICVCSMSLSTRVQHYFIFFLHIFIKYNNFCYAFCRGVFRFRLFCYFFILIIDVHEIDVDSIWFRRTKKI